MDCFAAGSDFLLAFRLATWLLVAAFSHSLIAPQAYGGPDPSLPVPLPHDGFRSVTVNEVRSVTGLKGGGTSRKVYGSLWEGDALPVTPRSGKTGDCRSEVVDV